LNRKKSYQLKEIIDDDVVMAFDHDLNVALGRVRLDGKRLTVDNVEAHPAA